MRNRRLLFAGLTAALALLLAIPALATPNTELEDDSETAVGTLTAVVANLGLTGRSITNVGATATAGSVLATAVGAAIAVAEVDANGVDGWYVAVKLDDDLSNGLEDDDEITWPASKVTATAGPTAGVVTLPLLHGTTTSAYTADDTTGLDTGSILFSVAGQSPSSKYTAVYTSSALFTVDLTGYTGAPAVLTAPYTVTLYQ